MTSTRQGGFTLIEVLAALVILLVAFGAALEIIRLGIRRFSEDEALTTATFIAHEKLGALGLDRPWQYGVFEGEEGHLAWRLEVQPYRDAAQSLRTRPDVTALIVTVSVGLVNAVDDPLVRFATLRLVPTAALSP